MVGIDNNSVSIKIYKTISEKPTVTSSFNWFDENESYKALGQDVLSGNYSPNLCANDWNVFNPEIPCHIGYPNQPWPSWVYINDELNEYYKLLYQTTGNGGPTMMVYEKM